MNACGAISVLGRKAREREGADAIIYSACCQRRRKTFTAKICESGEVSPVKEREVGVPPRFLLPHN